MTNYLCYDYIVPSFKLVKYVNWVIINIIIYLWYNLIKQKITTKIVFLEYQRNKRVKKNSTSIAITSSEKPL